MGKLLQFRSQPVAPAAEDPLVSFRFCLDGEDVTHLVERAEIEFADGQQILLYAREAEQ